MKKEYWELIIRGIIELANLLGGLLTNNKNGRKSKNERKGNPKKKR
jgi:hypothetical protein